MRHPVFEKLEIIRIVAKSHLPVRQTLNKLGIPRATFYRWHDLCRLGGIDALEDHLPLPGHVWNRVPDKVRRRLLILHLTSPHCRQENLRCALLTQSVTLSRNPRFIGC